MKAIYILTFYLLCFNVYSQDIYTIKSGNFFDECIWSTGNIPESGNNIYIEHNVTYNQDINLYFNNLIISQPGVLCGTNSVNIYLNSNVLILGTLSTGSISLSNDYVQLYGTLQTPSLNFDGQFSLSNGNINLTNSQNFNCLSYPEVVDLGIINICEADSANIFNNWESDSGLYIDTLFNGNCVENIYHQELVIQNNSNQIIDISICEGESYNFGDLEITSEGAYSDSLESVYGCDSIVTINMTINENTSSNYLLEVCDSYYSPINEETYYEPGLVIINSLNENGCEHIDSINLEIINNSYSIDSQIHCNEYTWIDGNTYNSSNNTATHILTNSISCDSIITLDLTILQSTYETDVQTHCNSYTWIDGNTYNYSNNTANHILTNSIGCDSIITLDLTIYESTFGTDIQSSCEEFNWIDGVTYTETNNTATFILTNSVGCDSIVTLDLLINTDTTIIDTTISCSSYEWNDSIYFQSGQYEYLQSFSTAIKFNEPSSKLEFDFNDLIVSQNLKIEFDLKLDDSFCLSPGDPLKIFSFNSPDSIYDYFKLDLYDNNLIIDDSSPDAVSLNTDDLINLNEWNNFKIELGYLPFAGDPTISIQINNGDTLNYYTSYTDYPYSNVILGIDNSYPVCEYLIDNFKVFLNYEEIINCDFETYNTDTVFNFLPNQINGLNQGGYLYNYSSSENPYNTANSTCAIDVLNLTIEIEESYNCVEGSCIDPMDCSGKFQSLEECEANCSAIEPTWDCSDDNVCFELSDGSGNFQSLEECEANCSAIEPTFNCIFPLNNGDGYCDELLDGTGEFSTLEDCEQECQNVSSINENIIDVNIYPNPSSNIFNLEFDSDYGTEIIVTNILGEQVYIESTRSSGEFNTQIDLSNYSKGIYNLTIKNSDGISNHKLILQ
jgi:hypothetical protein